MKPFLPFLLSFAFTGCTLRVYYPNGERLAAIPSNATNVHVTASSDSVTFSADTIDNAAPVLAAGKITAPAIRWFSTAAAMGQTEKVVTAVRRPIP